MNSNYHWHPHGMANRPLFPDRIGIWKLFSFFLSCGERKDEDSGKNPRSSEQNTRPLIKLDHIEVNFSQLSSHIVQCT